MRSSLGSSIILSCFLITLLSCGGSPGSEVPAFSLSSSPSLNEALEAFDGVMPFVDAGVSTACDCVGPDISCTCSCPGGGDVSVRAAEDMYWFSLTFNECVADDGLVFDGTMEGAIDETMDGGDVDDNQDTMNIAYDLTSFGNCTDLSGAVVIAFDGAEGADVCAGTLHATCGGQEESCNLSADCSSCR